MGTLDGAEAADAFAGHDRAVEAVAFSSDGTRIVSGDDGGTIRLWTLDGETPETPLLKLDKGGISSVAFSLNGNLIVSGSSDGTVRVLTVDGKLAAGPFESHGGRIRSVAFSPDGKRIVSGGDDGTVRLWFLDGKTATEWFNGHNNYVRSIAFSPDGKRIVSSADDGTTRLWNIATHTNSLLNSCVQAWGWDFSKRANSGRGAQTKSLLRVLLLNR